MAAENEVVEIGWIGCCESFICHEGDFEDDAIMDQGSRCTIEKGIVKVIQARENETAHKGRSCVNREERTCQIAQMRRLHDLMEAECSLKLR